MGVARAGGGRGDRAAAVTTTFDPQLLVRVQNYLINEKKVELPGWEPKPEERQRFLAAVVEAIVDLRVPLNGMNERAMAESMAGMMTEVGVLTPILNEEGVEEIIVRRAPDGRMHVQVERRGRIDDLGELADEAHFAYVVKRAADQGRQLLKGDTPMVVVDLPSGDRLTAIIPELSKNGVSINIRRFPRKPLGLDEMAANGSLTQEIADYLARVVRENVGSALIVGSSGAGKTTLLNALSLHIKDATQLAVAETFKELRLAHPYPLRAVARAELKPHEQAAGIVTMRDVVNTIYTRMRPDLILGGEVVSEESVEFLRAVALGSRAITTIHGASCLSGLVNLETLAVQYGKLDQHVARQWIARSIDLVIHVDRAESGSRFVSEVSLVRGLSAEGSYRLEAIFRHAEARGNRAEHLAQMWKDSQNGRGEAKRKAEQL